MPQYPVPQFIESEGKIINFLTFRQFFILVGGGAFCLAFYYIFPFTLFMILSIFVAILVVLIGFVKIDNESVVTLAMQALLFSTRSKNYVWKKKEAAYPFRVRKNPHGNIQELTGTEPSATTLGNAKKMVEYRKKI